MEYKINNIKMAGNRPIPHGLQLRLEYPGKGGCLLVSTKLPWQTKFTDFGLVPIVNGELVIPLTLAFLCHAKEDKSQVEQIGSQLLADGFLTWHDDKNLLPGDDWEKVIEREIANCDYFLAFLSSRSVTKKGYVNRELRYALEQRDHRPFGQRYIIPILLDECNPPAELEKVHFQRMWEPDAYSKLLRALSNKEAR